MLRIYRTIQRHCDITTACAGMFHELMLGQRCEITPFI